MNTRVVSCGSNEKSQLGRSLGPANLAAVDDMPEVLFVACGQYHSLAISAIGVAYGWGSNAQGQLSSPICTVVERPRKLDVGCLVSAFILKCAAGANHSVFLTHNGDVIEVGSGNGSPRRISIGERSVDIAAATNWSLGCTASGLLYLWDYSSDNKLSLPKATPLPPKTRVARIAASDTSAMIITTTGDLLTTTITAADMAAPCWHFVRHGSSVVQEISCGYTHSAAIHADGSVKLFQGKSLCTTQPPIRCTEVLGVACGRETTFFWTSAGKLFACGKNDVGQLGLGFRSATVHDSSEVELPPGFLVSQIACGMDHTVVLLQDAKDPPQRGSSGYSVPMEDMVLPIDETENARWDEEISNISFSKSTGWKKFLAAGTTIGDPEALIPERHDPFRHTRRVLFMIGSVVVLALFARSRKL